MLQVVIQKIFGSKNERELKKVWPIVESINKFSSSIGNLSDDDLKAKTVEFKNRIERGESLDSLLPEAFAVGREASHRVLGMRHFDVQLIGGIVLHQGKIAEMKTGEGKTLTATLPVYLNALAGKGVHVVTVNDYLARRDAEWMGKLYGFLGLSTGVVVNNIDQGERHRAYQSDITYGQNNEFGFDYLRDNMKLDLAEKVQRGHHFAIVDEVDSILIDEARTPLIISGPTDDSTDKYTIADEIVRILKGEEHYAIEHKTKGVVLTEEGVKFIEGKLQLENLYEPQNIELVHRINQALKAHVTMKRDAEYIVQNGEVIIVDEFSGRFMPGRRWSDGLHQAVEAKEKVKVAPENQTLATVTFQNYFRMYGKLAGMTGTADTEAVEFKKIYKLDVMVIPPNRQMVRKDFSDVIYSSERGKFKAVCEEIASVANTGQPILVGTASISKSEMLSALLKKQGIAHHVLNAKQHEKEAEIVAQAGRLGAVTISTNMAGRGTDILLGGNPEFLAAAECGTKDPEDAEYQESYEHFKVICAQEKEQVLAHGGLHIIGTERHESRRIDNQLRGRSGRQGDPGSSRFFISLEDDLMKRFGGERIQALMTRVGMTEEDAIEHPLIARQIEGAQKKVEGYHFDVRKHLLEYDDVLNKQREIVYKLRDKLLKEEGVSEQVEEMVADVIEEVVSARASEKDQAFNWDVKGMLTEMQRLFGIKLEEEGYLKRQEDAKLSFAQELFEDFKGLAIKKLATKKESFGEEQWQRVQKIFLLQSIDHYWKEHLLLMDYLKEGINLRGYGQKNPLYEYQREAFELFSTMMIAIKVLLVQNLFMIEMPSEEDIRQLEEREKEYQRQLEAQAKTVHEEVLEGADAHSEHKKLSAEEIKKANPGLNRTQRRNLQKS